MYSIIVSTKDKAGMNIKECLLGKGFSESDEEKFGHKVLVRDGVKLYTTDKDTIYSEGIDSEVDGDKLIFATRHSSSSGKRTLSVHVSGNWSKAEAGGKDRKLCAAMPGEMKKAFLLMHKRVSGGELEGFDVSMECTHHGPLVEKPCMWIEIGSEESSWKNKEAGELIADVIIDILDSDEDTDKPGKSVVVLGGGHYNMSANKLLLRTDLSVGHICPKHNLTALDEEMLRQAMEKNPGFSMFVLDWKGLGTEKRRVVELLENMGKDGVKYERYNRLVTKSTEKDQ